MNSTRICERTGKRRYDGREHAKRVMRGLSATLRAYACQHCRGWHLTKARGGR